MPKKSPRAKTLGDGEIFENKCRPIACGVSPFISNLVSGDMLHEVM